MTDKNAHKGEGTREHEMPVNVPVGAIRVHPDKIIDVLYPHQVQQSKKSFATKNPFEALSGDKYSKAHSAQNASKSPATAFENGIAPPTSKHGPHAAGMKLVELADNDRAALEHIARTPSFNYEVCGAAGMKLVELADNDRAALEHIAGGSREIRRLKEATAA